jgi:predicted Zn-dependent protease
MHLGALHEERGEVKQAADALRRLLTKGRVHLSVAHRPDLHARAAVRLGQLYIRGGERHRAERLWSDFLKRHPENAAIKAALAQSYAQATSIIVKANDQ